MPVVRRGPAILLIALSVLGILLLSSSAQTGSVSSIKCIINGTTTDPGTCIQSAIPLCLIGLAISVIILAVAYMAGEVLNYRSLKEFYRAQLWETVKSVIIVVIIFSCLGITSAIAVSLAGGSGSTSGSSIATNLGSLYTTVQSSYLTPQLQGAETSFAALMGLSVGGDLLRSLGLEVWIPVPVPPRGIPVVQFGADVNLLNSNYITNLYGDPTLSIATGSADIVTAMLLSFQVQSDLIYVIAAIGLGAFIPIGLIMRSFPFIRGLGGTMIAIGIGLSIVYPTLLIAFNLPISNYMFTFTSQAYGVTTCNLFPTLFCGLVNSMVSTVSSFTGFVTGTLPLTLGFGTNIPSVSTISGYGFYTGLFSPLTNGGIFPSLNFAIDNSLMQVVQFILFILDIIIGYVITNNIARLLGGKITLGVGRFKLA